MTSSLAEDSDSVPSTHMVAHNSLQSQFLGAKHSDIKENPKVETVN